LLLALGGTGVTAVAQDDAAPAGGGYGYLLDNVDFLLDNYTKFLVRRYDLDEEQEGFTRELLQQRAHEFLDQRKPELRELVDRLFEVRTGGEMDQQELIDWGKRALPMYNDAKQMLVAGNAEWREILTDEQRRIHDKDLARMHESFQMTEEQLDQIVTGQMTVDEFRNPPRGGRSRSVQNTQRSTVSKVPPTVNRREPVSPPGGAEPEAAGTDGADTSASEERSRVEPPPPPVKRPSDALSKQQVEARRRGQTSTPMRGRASRHSPADGRDRSVSSKGGSVDNFEGKWEAYVREFVEKYKLDDEQTQRANAILRDCQEKGRRYMAAKESTIAKLDARVVALKDYKGKDKVEQLSKINAQRGKLLAPIDRIFERELKPALDRLPTSAQKQAAAQSKKRESPERSSKDDGD